MGNERGIGRLHEIWQEKDVNYKKRLLISLILIITLLLATACSNSERLRVDAGETGVAIEQLPAKKVHEYTLSALAGEVLAIDIVSPKGRVHLAVEGEDGQTLTHAASKSANWTGVAPTTQDYVIRIAGNRQDTEYVLAVTRLPELGQEPLHRFVGVYHMKAPRANALHDLTLILDASGSAVLTGLSGVGSFTPFAMQGEWRAEGDVATVELAEQNGEAFTSPEIIKIEWRDGILAVSGHEVNTITSWRTAGLRFTPDKGDYHSMIRELHNRLATAGFVDATPPGAEGSIFTEATRRAVTAFQDAQGLLSHGVIDGATWAALDIALLPTHTPQGEPIVYLSFDDGPDGTNTPQILDLLARYDAQATFFVLGENAIHYPDLIRAEAEAGHYIANHGYAHHSFDDMDRNSLFREIQKTENLLREAAGDLFVWDGDVHFLRPPYGVTDASTQEFAAEFGYVMVMWDVDSLDWQRPGAQQIAWNVIFSVEPGDIVLMHDGGGERSQTILALEMILQELSTRGYRFKSIFD